VGETDKQFTVRLRSPLILVDRLKKNPGATISRVLKLHLTLSTRWLLQISEVNL